MGLTKQYLRYTPCGSFNLISSINCNICFVVYNGQEGRYVATGACENVIIWDLRLGEKVSSISSDVHSEAVYIAASSDNVHIAVGFADGKINIVNIKTNETKTVFSGHKTAISYLAFDKDGQKLASGGKDTEIVIWDLISECGLTRLSGHKGVVTSLAFFKHKNILISSSKDTYIKFWDLDTSHCFHTIAAHVTEVWGLSLVGEDEYVVAGSNDSSLMVWSLETDDEVAENPEFNAGISIKKAGSILREGRGRLVSLVVDNTGREIACHGVDSNVELFSFFTKEEANLKCRKRLAKERKKAAKSGAALTEQSTDVTLKDVVRRNANIKVSGKVKSVTTIKGNNELRFCVSLSNNMLELYSVSSSDEKKLDKEEKLLRKISQAGHQGEVRAVAFSSDNLAIATVGSSSVKLWNRVSFNCLRTVETDYALCVCFVPGDRHAIVGLKNGHILVIDLSAGRVLEEIEAHTTEVWSIIRTHDQVGVISGSGDTTVKFWNFEFVLLEGAKSKDLSILHTRTLKLKEPVLSVRASPCGKFIAASLLDSTVSIFFVDTFKFFVSLYGHSLPVLCSDISYDSQLIATGSADRKIKIWGLDFGDCHKSLFAHDDSVTALEFVPNTHYLFSCGKDGKVKQWDADSFDKIITLEGHFGECWNLCVGGPFVVSCGKDRVVRLFEKTDEPLVLSDEQEEEREKEELATGQDSKVKLPSIKTLSSERGAENLMECVDLLTKYKEEFLSGSKPEIPIMMKALNVKTPKDYLAKTISMIRPSDLEEALLLLPLHTVVFLLEMLPKLLRAPSTCEIACKTLLLLLKVHQGPISSDSSQIILLDKLKSSAFDAVQKFRDLVGLNLHSLLFHQREIEEKEGVLLFRDASLENKQKVNRKRRKEVATKAAVVLTMKL